MDYKQAGVDVEEGDKFVEAIKTKVLSTYNARVVEGVGGFAALYQISEDKLLAAGTDGVGTKLKLAQFLDEHHTIGIDLVAMCANDVICTGAAPLFFLDYLAIGKLDAHKSALIIDGIIQGCLQSEMALIGGETAEMPGMYPDGEYDLAGFCVGEISKTQVIDGKKIKDGDTLIGLPSSGFHSNGYSLLRKLCNHNEVDFLKELMTPTRIYVKTLKKLLANPECSINGLAHITGGGIQNIKRLNPHFDYHLTHMPSYKDLPSMFERIAKTSELSRTSLYNTFNMGVGMVIMTSTPQKVQAQLSELNEAFWTIGHIQTGLGKVHLV